MASRHNSHDQAAAVSGAGGGRHGAAVGQHVVQRTRLGAAWVAAALFAVVLLLLLIFVLENARRWTLATSALTGTSRSGWRSCSRQFSVSCWWSSREPVGSSSCAAPPGATLRGQTPAPQGSRLTRPPDPD